MSERLLVVNADDFGLTPGVCRAVLRAGEHGIVTSTSVMATGSALTQTAVAALRDSGIAVGAHLTVVGGGAPLLSAREIPSLVDRSGHLPATWRTFVARVARRAIDPGDVEREMSAQVDALEGAGLQITHLDTHQNVHLWPSVGRAVLRVASRTGVGFVRVPRTARHSPLALGVRLLSSRLTRRVRGAALPVTADTVGLDEAGAFHEAALHAAIERLGGSGAPTADIVCHPGEARDSDLVATGWGFHWEEETEVLTDPTTADAVRRAGFRLATYADLAGNPSPAPPASPASPLAPEPR